MNNSTNRECSDSFSRQGRWSLGIAGVICKSSRVILHIRKVDIRKAKILTMYQDNQSESLHKQKLEQTLNTVFIEGTNQTSFSDLLNWVKQLYIRTKINRKNCCPPPLYLYAIAFMYRHLVNLNCYKPPRVWIMTVSEPISNESYVFQSLL